MAAGSGDHAAAARMFGEALAVIEVELGPGNRHTVRTLTGLGTSMSYSGDREGAVNLLRGKLERRIELLGPDHPASVTCAHDLGIALNAAGDRAGAKRRFAEAREAALRTLRPNHRLTLVAACNLGDSLAEDGELAEAEALMEEAVSGFKASFGPGHPTTASSEARLERLRLQRLASRDIRMDGGGALRGRDAAPRAFLGPAASLGARARARAEAVREFERRISDRDRSAAAVAARTELLGEGHLETLEAMEEFADARLALGDAAGARSTIARAAAVADASLGRRDRLAAALLLKRAVAEDACGSPEEASASYAEALARLD
jgi:hypothetical protein